MAIKIQKAKIHIASGRLVKNRNPVIENNYSFPGARCQIVQKTRENQKKGFQSVKKA
jgi:hypothetical protein